MDAMTIMKERRSVRKFKDDTVERSILNEIISTATYSPTWANFQIVRYTVIENKELLNTLADEGMNGFVHNMNIVKRAPGLVVVSHITGKSGRSPQGEIATSKGESWEMFDAGIACQTFCLAAHAQGVGTVIMGIFDEEKVAEFINLPEDEAVAAIIPFGYEVEHPKAPPRKAFDDVVRYL